MLAHFAVTCALVGLIWTIQIVQYPLFDRVGREAFPTWHAAYTAAITWVVAPLMLAELASALWLLGVVGYREPLFLASLLPLALVWMATAFVQVPLHGRLARGFDAASHRRLVRSNWLRTSAWTLRAGLLHSLLA
jgi:hypothetical protein